MAGDRWRRRRHGRRGCLGHLPHPPTTSTSSAAHRGMLYTITSNLFRVDLRYLSERPRFCPPRLLAAEPPGCRFRQTCSAARWAPNSSPARLRPEHVSLRGFSNGRAIPFADRSTHDDSCRVKLLRGICLPKQGRARARAGEDRTIASTKLVHPAALSRPTKSCSYPLFSWFLPMGLVPTSTRLTQGPFRLPSGCCAAVLSGPRQLLL
jgi:hypothetical protein